MNLFRPISISLSPNTEKDDIRLALKLLFQPRRWKTTENDSLSIEEGFKEYLGAKHVFSFNSGRSALMAILNSLELQVNDEVLLQAFTCNAAVNPIIWSDLKPIFVDCDERTFNIDIGDLKRKIALRQAQGGRPKVLIVQHTFGLPADMEEILEICRQNNLILIEDCAHALGAEYKSKKGGLPAVASAKVGTFGKAAFFSFSRDKVISSVYGGMAATNDEGLAEKLKKYQMEAGFPHNCWIFQQLLHPVLMNYLILPAYSFLRLGKTLLSVFQWLQILSKAVHWKEKRGRKPGYFPKRLPNALEILALNQFKKLEKFNQHRKEIAQFYYNEIKRTCPELAEGLPLSPDDRKQIFLRFTIKHPKAHQIIKKAWQKNLLIGDWYTVPIAPHDTKLDKMQYEAGSCPKSEKLSQTTLNLPTHINISEEDAKKIIEFLKAHGN